MQALRKWASGLLVALTMFSPVATAQEVREKAAGETPPPAGPSPVIESPDTNVILRAVPNAQTLPADPTSAINFNAAVLFVDPNQLTNVNRNQYVAFVDGQPDPGKYWIGLLCVDAGEALREQLGLEPGVGLLVEAVTDDAPAKKAGMQKNDVLVNLVVSSEDPKAEPKPLKTVAQLVEAVQKAETKPLRLTLVRRGQKQSVELTPAERPQVLATPVRVSVQLQQAENQAQQLLQAQAQAEHAAKEADRARSAVKALEHKLHEQRLGLRLAGPIYVPPTEAPKLPEGMTMEFRQVVGQPEQILVRKGDQKWEVTAEHLDKLPEDVRAMVAQQMAFRRGAVPPPMPLPPGVAPGQPNGHFPTVMRYTAVNPIALPNTVEAKVAVLSRLPDDLSVTVTRTGAEPARITVKNKEQSWDITETELDKLPAEIRKHVEPFVSRRGMGGSAGMSAWAARVPSPAMPAPHSDAVERFQETQEAARRQYGIFQQFPPSTDAARQLQERQDAMLKQLQQLTEKVEKLQQALEKAAPKP